MTREEAIEKLELMRQKVDEETYRALILAIQALSQEPCDDAISREDAIESIANIDETDGTVAIFTGKQVIALLKDLPSVNPQPCDDAISRKKAICVISACDGKSAQIEALEQLPSVTQKPTECDDAISRPTVVKFEGTNMACMGGDEIMKEFENNTQQRCDDKVISLERAKKQIGRWIGYIDQDMINRICISLEQLPSVTHKSGKWIEHEIKDTCRGLTCSNCGYEWINRKENYCPNCGAKMESEEV